MINNKENDHPGWRDGALFAKAALRWHKAELPDVEVADLNLTGISVEDNDDLRCLERKPARKKFEELIDRFDPATPDGRYLAATGRGFLAYIDALSQQRHLPWVNIAEYLGETMGLTAHLAPSIRPEEVLDQQRQRVKSSYANVSDYEYSEDGWRRYLDSARLNPYGIKGGFHNANEKFQPLIERAMGREFKTRFDIKFVRENEYWIAWFSARPEGHSVRINTHPRNERRWLKGREEVLFIHEAGVHEAQADSWEENVKNGVINPGYGVVPVPGPAQWGSEGFASTLPDFVPEMYDQLSPDGKFVYELQLLTDLVYGNVHLWANGFEGHPGDLHEYIWQYLPGETKFSIDRALDERTINPKLRSYLLSYPASHDFREYAAWMTQDQRNAFIRALNYSPRTPIEIDEIANSFVNPSPHQQIGIGEGPSKLVGKVMSGLREALSLQFRHGSGDSTAGAA